MIKATTSIFLTVIIIFNFSACAPVKPDLPKNSRLFIEKPFDSGSWMEGDSFARGQMANDLRQKNVEDMASTVLYGKTQAEILKILGEPNQKTQGRVYEIGYSPEAEIWLYNVEMPEAGSTKITNKHLQIFFSSSESTVIRIKIEKWKPIERRDTFPRVG